MLFGFDEYNTSPISCGITMSWQEINLHLIAPTCTQCLFRETVTVKPFPGLMDGHVRVPFSRAYFPNTVLPFALLCHFIPKGVWAESNDPLWRPSHTAATPLIFSDTPCRLKGSMAPRGLPFTKCKMKSDIDRLEHSVLPWWNKIRFICACICRLFRTTLLAKLSLSPYPGNIF